MKRLLRTFLNLHVTEDNINEFGRFDELKTSVDRNIAKVYFERIENTTIPPHKIQMKIDNILRRFIFMGGFDIE